MSQLENPTTLLASLLRLVVVCSRSGLCAEAITVPGKCEHSGCPGGIGFRQPPLSHIQPQEEVGEEVGEREHKLCAASRTSNPLSLFQAMSCCDRSALTVSHP